MDPPLLVPNHSFTALHTRSRAKIGEAGSICQVHKTWDLPLQEQLHGLYVKDPRVSNPPYQNSA